MADTAKNIVVIGASAGGLTALQLFFANLPFLSDTAILVAQHPNLPRGSQLVKLLGSKTDMPVAEVKSGTSPQSRMVYITPTDRDVKIVDAKITLEKPNDTSQPKPPVDALLKSLSSDKVFKHKIAVILAGTGTDGSSSLPLLKESGGYILVQEPKTAEYDVLPQAAIATGTADAILEPEKLGREIQKILNNPESAKMRPHQSDFNLTAFEEILLLLKKRPGTDFSIFKEETIEKGIAKRMSSLRINTQEEYRNLLKQYPSEAEELINIILKRVAKFFKGSKASASGEEKQKPTAQSTEVGKEELQSSGEQLRKAYSELKKAYGKLERKEGLLKERQSNVSALLENKLQAFVLLDSNFKIKVCNSKAVALFRSLTEKNIEKGDSFLDFVGETNLEKFRDFIKKSTGPEGFTSELKLKNAFGEDCWYKINLSPVIAEGQIEVISLSLLDISEQKELASNLINREKLLESVLNASSVGICITNSSGIFTRVNDQYCKIYGYSREELLGQHFTMITPEEDRTYFKKLHDDFLISGKELPGEFITTKKDGTFIRVSVSAELLELPGGERFKVTSVRDITEERAAEELLDDAVKLSKIGGWEYSPSEGKLKWTKNTYHIHELEDIHSEVNVSTAVGYYKDGPDREQIKFLFERLMKDEIPYDEELKIVTARGNEKWIRTIGRAEKKNNKIVRLYGTFQDISEKKELESKLQTVSNNLAVVFIRYQRWPDGRDRFLFMSPSVEKIWGLRPSAIKTDSGILWKKILPQDSSKFLNTIMESEKSLEPWKDESRFYNKDGHIIWLRGMGIPERQTDGSTIWDSLMFDVTAEREAAEKIRLISDNLPAILLQYKLNPDKTVDILYLSRGILELVGKTHSEVIENSSILWDRVYPEDRDELFEKMKLSGRKLKPWKSEYRVYRKDGTIGWHRGNGHPMKQRDGSIIWDTIILDVTEEVEAKERLQKVSDNIPGVIMRYRLNPDGTDRLIHASKGAKFLWGLSADQAMEKNALIWENYNTDDKSEQIQTIKDSAENLTIWRHEWRYHHPNLGLRWHRGVGKPKKLLDGSVEWDTLILDITEEKLAEETLRESENRLKQLLDKMDNIAVQAYGEDGRVRYWNTASENVYGYTREEAMGKKFTDLIIPVELRAEVEGKLSKMFGSGIALPPSESIVRRKDHSRVPVYTNFAMVTTAAFDRELFCIDVDLSEQKAAQKQLRETLDILKERIKGHKALNEVSNLNEQSLSITDLLSKTAQILKKAFKKPEKTEVGINFREEHCQTRGFAGIEAELALSVSSKSKNVTVVIGLISSQLESNISPEEKNLVKATAEILDLKITRKLAIKEIHQKSGTLQRILDQSLDVICSIDQEGNFVEVSAASESVWGYRPEEMIGKKYKDFVFQKDHEITEKIFEKIIEGNPVTNFENRYIRKDGSLVTVIWSARWDEQDKVLYCIAKDATDLKNAQKELEDREKRFNTILNEGSDRIAILDEGGKYTYLSPNYEKLVGYKPQELMSSNSFEVIHPEDREAVKEEFIKLKNKGRVTSPHFRFKCKDGRWAWMESIGTDLTHDPIINGFVINTREITERMLVEQALKASEEKYRNLFNLAPLPKLIYDLNSLRILDVNKTACLQYGYNKKQFLTLSLRNLFPQADLRKLKEVQKEVKPKSELIQFGVCTNKRKDGSKLRMDINGHPINYDEREAILLVCNDLTEKERVMQELKISNERFEFVTKATFGSIWDWQLKDNYIFRGKRFEELFGYSQKDIDRTKFSLYAYLHPDDKNNVKTSLNTALKGEENFWMQEYRFRKKDGSYVYVRDRAVIIRNPEGMAQRVIGVQIDISEERYYNLLEQLEKRILELSAVSNPNIASIADFYMEGIEALHPGMKCSLMEVIDGRIYTLAAPSLDQQYLDEITGEKIGPNAGSCGTAAYTGEAVIVEDINNDKRWKGYSQLGEKYGFRGCWSLPIKNSGGKTIATFSAYYKDKKKPVSKEWNTVQRASQLLQIILDSYHQRQNLLSSNERYEYVNKATSDAIYDWDIINDRMIWGESFTRIFGYSFEEDHTFSLSNSFQLILEEDKDRVEEAFEKFLFNTTDTKWNADFRVHRADGSIAYAEENAYLIRNESGEPIRMIGVLRDVSRLKEEEHRLRLMESVVTNTQDSVIITEAEPIENDGPKIVYVNEAFTRMTGYSREEVIGKTPRILQGPKSDKKELERLKKSLKNWQSCEVELINYKKSGEEFWINFRVSPVANEKGWYTHWISVERDITSRKIQEVEKELKTSISAIFGKGEKLDTALEKTVKSLIRFTDIEVAEVWLASKDNKSIYLQTFESRSSAFKKMKPSASQEAQLSSGEGFPGKVWRAGKAIKLKSFLNNPDFIRLKSAKRVGLESAYGLPLIVDGHVLGVLLAFFSKNSPFHLYQSVLDEMATHLAVEIRRKQLEEDLNRLFDTSPDIICVAGFDGYFKRINSAASTILEYSQNELLETHFEKFIHPDDRKNTINSIRQQEVDPQTLYFENRCYTKSGNIKWIAWTISPVFEEKIVFAVGKDITFVKELERLHDRASELAKIGSWELDLEQNRLYWSPISGEIFGVPSDYQPDFHTAPEFYKSEEGFNRLKKAFELCVSRGERVDEETKIQTGQGIEKWVRVIGESEFRNGKCIKIQGSIQDIHDHKIIELELARKTKLISTISRVNSILLDYESWNLAIEECFSAIAETLDADRVYYFENEWDEEQQEWMSSQRLEWNRDDVEPQINNPELQKIPFGRYKEIFNPMKNGSVFSSVVEDISEIQFKKHLQDQNIVSLLLTPIYIKNVFWGFIGCDDCRNERIWSDEEISFLITLTSNLASAIERHSDGVELKRAFEEKNTILSSIDDAFYTLDNNWVFTYWNRRAEEILGLSRKNVLGKSIWEVYPEEKREDSVYYQKLNEANITGSSVHFEAFSYDLNIWFDVSIYPSSAGLSVYLKDITQRKKTEEKLRQSNERFQKVSEVTNDAIWDWNVSKNTLSWGESLGKLFGYKDAGRVSTINKWMKLVHKTELARVEKSLTEAIKNPDVDFWQEEYKFKKADGSFAFVIDRASIIRDENRKAIRAVGSLQDISSQKEFEQSLKKLNVELEQRAKELAESNLELEQFAYAASHDLQEPLRMISSFLRQLEKKYGEILDDKGKQYIHFAVDGAKRMREIILGLLEYSRVGRLQYESEEVDLSALIEDIKILLREQINKSGAEIKTSLLPVVNAPLVPMRQIFQNLISNAVKYQQKDQNPLVEIGFKEYKTKWEFVVKDNGIGIQADQYDRVFVIFQRLHSRSEYEGTGMGLAVTKKIVDNFGGEIWIDSTPGKGSAFYFTIPKQIN